MADPVKKRPRDGVHTYSDDPIYQAYIVQFEDTHHWDCEIVGYGTCTCHGYIIGDWDLYRAGRPSRLDKFVEELIENRPRNKYIENALEV